MGMRKGVRVRVDREKAGLVRVIIEEICLSWSWRTRGFIGTELVYQNYKVLISFSISCSTFHDVFLNSNS